LLERILAKISFPVVQLLIKSANYSVRSYYLAASLALAFNKCWYELYSFQIDRLLCLYLSKQLSMSNT